MEITADLLLKAYTIGVFPMAESHDSPDLHWIDPENRGILPLKKVHIPRSLRKILRNPPYQILCDTVFEQVLDLCAQTTVRRPDTWINPLIKSLYLQLYERGFAHSVECWLDGKLIGGLYGVSLGGAFFGESMFSRHSNASKVALIHLAARLYKGGYKLLDTQFTTHHLSQFGTVDIGREDYKARLLKAIQVPAYFPMELSKNELEDFIELSRHNRPAIYSGD
ncbi:leucyl/phenylalanyl-tRNA--protein transferase [Kiloniella laminariae]|uniref:leucyl/phenylalanyl-tRNA--protein transferase n=1 Tax=Kiloniella laminariae TaxID=454162 RepID=UPI00037EA30A|nr:leucyl/phenylalanyl-tRNA--protein transferase [Kiloniella laminariae]